MGFCELAGESVGGQGCKCERQWPSGRRREVHDDRIFQGRSGWRAG